MFVATTDGNVILKGTVFANAGKIGGYTIEENVLKNGKVGMSSNNDIAGSISFWSGNENAQFAPFQVTNEGKLIASDANITGVINAESGKIGGLIFDNNGISSGKDGLTFTSDGLIIANQLEINDYFQAKHLQVEKVSGRGAGTASLNFESGTKEVRNMTASVSFHVVDEGSAGSLVTSWKPGRVDITVTTNYPAVFGKTFNVRVNYSRNAIQSGHVVKEYTHVDLPITIKKGATHATVSTGYRIYQKGVFTLGFGVQGSSIVTVSPSAWIDETGAIIDSISCKGSFLPEGDDSYDLGSGEHRWKVVYATTPDINTSDINLKTDVSSLSEAYGQLFDKLRPVSYKFKKNDSDRHHMGLIAQEFKEAIEEVGLTTKDVAAYCEWKTNNGETLCGIRYGELIPLLISEVQKLKRIINQMSAIKNNNLSEL